MAPELHETAALLVHTLGQLLYAFERLDSLPDQYDEGSPAMAFYLTSIYSYISLLFLLGGGESVPMHGTAYPALKRHGLESLLEPIQVVLDEPLGETSFGETIRVFRNKAVVHSTHATSDLDRIYRDVDMALLENQLRWHQLLRRLRGEIGQLALRVAESTGRPVQDFGFRQV